ncbi:MAG: roadblock/LC7 domain-containing protein [Promethearchaeota archaeon]|nr:MAG: roadblock/LC7 domain-containing protein [Candidatus Lokiarchaeota archaeon]
MIDSNEIKAIIRRFEEKEGVRGVIICDTTGLPIKSNLSTDMTEEVSAYITALIGKSKQVVDSLKEGSLKFIRLETSKGEIMVALEENLILIILK